jgi:hypothetical protein
MITKDQIADLAPIRNELIQAADQEFVGEALHSARIAALLTVMSTAITPFLFQLNEYTPQEHPLKNHLVAAMFASILLDIGISAQTVKEYAGVHTLQQAFKRS